MTNSLLFPMDRTSSGATTPNQNRFGSDDNKDLLSIPQSFKTKVSSSDCLISYPGNSFYAFTPLHRCSLIILDPLPSSIKPDQIDLRAMAVKE